MFLTEKLRQREESNRKQKTNNTIQF